MKSSPPLSILVIIKWESPADFWHCYTVHHSSLTCTPFVFLFNMTSTCLPILIILALLLPLTRVDGFLRKVIKSQDHQQSLLSLQGEASAMTQKMFESISDKRESGGAGGSASFEGLRRLDEREIQPDLWPCRFSPCICLNLGSRYLF